MFTCNEANWMSSEMDENLALKIIKQYFDKLQALLFGH